MSDVVVTPPDLTEWWSANDTLANVLVKLRLGESDIDEDRLQALIPAAGHHVNVRMDRPEGTEPTDAELVPLQEALEQAVIEMYQNPAEGGLSKSVRAQVGTVKKRWGIA